jgi:hypothetical protein
MSQSAATPADSYRVRIEPTADGSGNDDHAPELSPREARDRWLVRIRASRAESTISSYHYRTKHFVERCEDQAIGSVNRLNGWDIDEFETDRRAEGLETTSLNNELGTLKKLLEYYENDPEARHSRAHVLLTLGWFAGPPRLGGIRGLDLGDHHSDEQYVEYKHRPEEGTPLKNNARGERAVGPPDRAAEVIDGYLEKNRYDVRDDYGREPLVTSQRGRPSKNAVRVWMYLATVPCLHSECPHGNDRDTCESVDYSTVSQCPSSRSPHQVRTGAITWMRNRGIPVDVVAARANASVSVIEKHYDKPDYVEKIEKRSNKEIDKINFEDNKGNSE